MSKVKISFYAAIVVLGVVGVMKWSGRKEKDQPQPGQQEVVPAYQRIEPEDLMQPLLVEEVKQVQPRDVADRLTPLSSDSQVPKSLDRMALLFNPFPPTLPIVHTMTYAAKVPWLQGRPAYLGDYAAYFKTSKHFISRSLHGSGQFFSDVVSRGDRFNVIRTDHNIEFHLVVDLSRLKMWVYSYDATDGVRLLLKDYRIAAGKRCANSPSGSLTPTGVFALGNEIAVYSEGMTGYYHQKKIDMLSVFGRRWIPFAKEVAESSGPCRGLGIHGMPCRPNPITGEWVECGESVGDYASDGCIRMLNDDITELFSVIVSRPSYIHIVRDFTQAKLPGVEQF